MASQISQTRKIRLANIRGGADPVSIHRHAGDGLKHCLLDFIVQADANTIDRYTVNEIL